MYNKQILREYIRNIINEEYNPNINEGTIKDFVKRKASIALMILPALLANIGSVGATPHNNKSQQQSSYEISNAEYNELEELFDFIDTKYGDYENIKTQSDLTSEFEIVKGYFYTVAKKRGYSEESINRFLESTLDALLVNAKHLENYEKFDRKITQQTNFFGSDELAQNINNILNNKKYDDIRKSLNKENFTKHAESFRKLFKNVNDDNINKLVKLIKINFNFFGKYNLNHDQLYTFIVLLFNEDPSYEKVIKTSMSGNATIHYSNLYKSSLEKIISLFVVKGFDDKTLERATKEILEDENMKNQLINYLAIVKCLIDNKSSNRGKFFKDASEAAKAIVRFDATSSDGKGKARGRN